ncbi:MAG TPA: hypothetical protein VN841_27975 [Bryobacteraceae bacterium]|nr:hypothetical protein [Bryobacteraceae bacterium]
MTASGTAGGYSFSTPINMPLGGAITGAPYSAEQEQEHVQTLADGTHITQKQPGQKMWRDSQGRTRTERAIMMGRQIAPGVPPPPTIIEITDPVEGVRYVLDSQSKVAHRAAAPQRAAVVEVRNAAGQAVPAAVGFDPLSTAATQTRALRPREANAPQFATEDLGTQLIEGVTAQGRRQTVTYPIGAFGNDRPIVTTSETWTSPDLRVAVLTKSSDPRSGESTMRLTNISRTEPDPALFQPPPDYRIEEESGNSINIRSGVPPPPPPVAR